ncbi:MAG: phosphoenolpyruvate synthase, partial [Bacteroidota bacterium]|nr:phosphoenolpyruvate synthase [Bacteroidota bacterium]
MKPRILEFKKIGIGDIAQVGGKNASLGEMITKLASAGIPVPDGFAITSESFIEFLNSNGLVEKLQALMSQLDRVKYANLRELGLKARKWILEAVIPPDLKKEVIEAYQKLSNGTQIEVAVRSSATAEDLPQASFAGQHDSYLNIKGDKELLQAVQKCYASLYTDRAIKYREDNGFAHEKVFLSIGVQKMVRSDKASSGVCFTLEPESGFRDIVHISGVWGLGENIVQGTVIPDEYFVFKPTLLKGKFPIIQKKLGDKDQTMIYSENPEEPVRNIPTSKEKREQYVLSDEEIIQIARWAMAIEDHYRKPMDLEWAKDGLTQEIFIIQARPETVQSRKNPLMVKEFELLEKADPLVQGNAVGSKITVGKARILDSPDQSAALQPGEIVVTNLTSPDWDPILMNAGGIITNEGGRTSHASIVARELGVPAVVGCGNATKKISDGEMITISCAEGKTGNVYRGKMAFREIELDFSKIRKPKSTKVMLIAGDPDKAFKWSFYPNDGVGLMRIEFIIMHTIQIHPMALVRFDALKDLQAKQRIEKLTHHYADKKQFFVDKLAEGIATIAASFYPKEVIVRMSDFKTN